MHRPEQTTASFHLSLPEIAYYPKGQLDVVEQKRLAFARTYRAYQELQVMNTAARKRLSNAISLFAIGIGLVVAVIVIYIVIKTWTIL